MSSITFMMNVSLLLTTPEKTNCTSQYMIEASELIGQFAVFAAVSLRVNWPAAALVTVTVRLLEKDVPTLAVDVIVYPVKLTGSPAPSCLVHSKLKVSPRLKLMLFSAMRFRLFD